MENLKKALSRVLHTFETIMKAYADKKISVGEWIGISYTGTAWIWIFKNLDLIFEDVKNAQEAPFQQMMEELKVEFDIPQDEFEERFEQALSLVMNIIVMVFGKADVSQAIANVPLKRNERNV
jgi:hypothetical protein